MRSVDSATVWNGVGHTSRLVDCVQVACETVSPDSPAFHFIYWRLWNDCLRVKWSLSGFFFLRLCVLIWSLVLFADPLAESLVFCGHNLCGNFVFIRARCAYSSSWLVSWNKTLLYSLLCCAWYKEAAMEGIAPRFRAPGLAAALSQISFATWLRSLFARRPFWGSRVDWA